MRLSFTAFSLGLSSAALGACAADDPTGGDDVVVTASALDRCAEPGVALTEAWNVDNLHGRIVALTIADDGTAVVATEDGAVKQWSLGVDADAAPLPGGRPSYGVPFEAGDAPVRAVAIAGELVLGAGSDGTLRQWALSDSSTLPAQTMKLPLTAVAGLGDDLGVIADENFGGGIRTVSLADGETSAAFETSLWGVTTMVRTDDALFVAGHDYGIAAVERRDPSAPDTVVGVWDPEGAGGGGEFLQGWITSVAVSTDGSTLVAGSDGASGGLGFVFTIDPENLQPGPTAVLEQAGVRAVAVTATGAHIAVATDGHVALHPADLGAAIGGIDVADPVALAIDPSGERLIVASGDGHLRAFTCEE